jgi:hypothetical protein
MEQLQKIETQKHINVSELISLLNSTENYELGVKIAFLLVENFKDDRIIDCLINLINSDKWKNRTGSLWFALEEYLYTDNQKFLKLLNNTIINNDNEQNGEIFMNTYSIIVTMKPPLSIYSINWSLKRIKKEREKNNNEFKQQLLNSLELFFEGQKIFINNLCQ